MPKDFINSVAKVPLLRRCVFLIPFMGVITFFQKTYLTDRLDRIQPINVKFGWDKYKTVVRSSPEFYTQEYRVETNAVKLSGLVPSPLREKVRMRGGINKHFPLT